MTRRAPLQKPGRSEQSVQTPPEFLKAVKRLLGIDDFSFDLAADEKNSVAGPYFFDEAQDSLKQKWSDVCGHRLGWAWLNPPYAKLGPWLAKCAEESERGAWIAVLVPNSPGANWWFEHVQGKGYVTNLRQRIKFVGHTNYYPKDLALILYAPYLQGGQCWWKWRG